MVVLQFPSTLSRQVPQWEVLHHTCWFIHVDQLEREGWEGEGKEGEGKEGEGEEGEGKEGKGREGEG